MLVLKAFGTLDVQGDRGAPLTSLLTQSKRAALFSYLVLSRPGEMHRRDALLALFWPELDPTHGRNALSQALSFLRRELGDGVLVTRGTEEVGVDAVQITSDVRAFEDALAAEDWAGALGAYGGDLLEGLHAVGAAPFTDWVDRERERLREAASGAAWKCAHTKIAAGELTGAERAGQRALELVPTDESPVRAFIQALAAAGDRAAAVNFFEKFRSRLRDELELEPSAATVRLAEELRHGDAGRLPVALDGGSTATREEHVWPEGTSPHESATGNPAEIVPRSAGSPRPAASMLGKTPIVRRGALLWLPALALGAAATVIGLVHDDLKPGRRDPGPPLVAVAPFEGPSGRRDLDDLGSYVATMVGDRLEAAGIAEVLDVSRVGEALEVAREDPDPRGTLARTLGAGIIVTGTLLPLGDSVWIRVSSASLLNNEEPHPIKPVVASMDEPCEAARLVQDRVAAVLAQYLDDSYGWKDIDPPSTSLEAYVEYRRGQEVKRQMGDWNDAALHYLRAFELDPSYYAAGLDAVGALDYVGRHQERDSIVRILDDSRDRMPAFYRQGLDWLRMAAQGQSELALQSVRRMAETHPIAMAYNLGLEAQRNNFLEESAEALGRWERGDGQWLESFVATEPQYFGLYCEVLHLLERYEKELEVAQEGHRRFPSEALEEVDFVLSALRARVGLGRVEEVVNLTNSYRRTGQLRTVWPVSDELIAHGHAGAAETILEKEVLREADIVPGGVPVRDRAHLLHRLGRHSEALALWRQVAKEHPDSLEAIGSLGITAARVGNTAVALEMDGRLETWPDTLKRGRHTFWRAKIATALGDKERAVELLHRVPTLKWAVYLEAHRDFDLRPLRGYPPFEAFAKPKR